MSKSAGSRAEKAEKKRLKLEREREAAKLARIRKITAIITASVLGAAIIAGLIGLAVYNARLNSGEYLRSRTAASSANIDVDGAAMNYFYNDIYNSFVDYYGSYVSYYGLDPSYSAKVQEMSDGMSWFAYFMSGAQDNVTALLALNEAANAEGFAVDEAERAALENRVKRTDVGLYGRGVNREDILNAKSLELVAYKYQFAKQNELTPTESEINSAYKANPKRYRSVDYLAYELDSADGAFSADEVKKHAKRLSDCKDAESFKKVMRELLKQQYSSMTDAELDKELTLHLTEGVLYSEGNEFSEWAFGGAKVGDCFTDEDGTSIRVYMLTRAPERDESSTATVRHILFSTEEYGSLEAALKQAESVKASLSADGTAVALAALEWSDDVGSYYNGGLCEDVVEGMMVTEFDRWCFDKARKPGDLELIESSLGIHIMYYVGEGREVWQASACEDIVAERFSELSAELLTKYPVEFNLPLLEEIPG